MGAQRDWLQEVGLYSELESPSSAVWRLPGRQQIQIALPLFLQGGSSVPQSPPCGRTRWLPQSYPTGMQLARDMDNTPKTKGVLEHEAHFQERGAALGVWEGVTISIGVVRRSEKKFEQPWKEVSLVGEEHSRKKGSLFGAQQEEQCRQGRLLGAEAGGDGGEE